MNKRNLSQWSLSVLLFLALSGCSHFRGQDLQYAAVPTGYQNLTMQYGVYTPPGWTVAEQLPLVL